VAVAIRSMFRAVLDATRDGAWLDDESGEDVLLGLAQTFHELAAGVDAFGQLVRDESEATSQITSADVQALRDGLEGMHEARARLEESLMSGSGPTLVELHAAVLSTVKRLLRELALEERVRRQVRLARPARTRLPHRAAQRRPTGQPESSVAPSEAETQLLPEIPRKRRDKPPPPAP